MEVDQVLLVNDWVYFQNDMGGVLWKCLDSVLHQRRICGRFDCFVSHLMAAVWLWANKWGKHSDIALCVCVHYGLVEHTHCACNSRWALLAHHYDFVEVLSCVNIIVGKSRLNFKFNNFGCALMFSRRNKLKTGTWATGVEFQIRSVLTVRENIFANCYSYAYESVWYNLAVIKVWSRVNKGPDRISWSYHPCCFTFHRKRLLWVVQFILDATYYEFKGTRRNYVKVTVWGRGHYFEVVCKM